MARNGMRHRPGAPSQGHARQAADHHSEDRGADGGSERVLDRLRQLLVVPELRVPLRAPPGPAAQQSRAGVERVDDDVDDRQEEESVDEHRPHRQPDRRDVEPAAPARWRRLWLGRQDRSRLGHRGVEDGPGRAHTGRHHRRRRRPRPVARLEIHAFDVDPASAPDDGLGHQRPRRPPGRWQPGPSR